ncbi:MAG: Uma2 family endonuclease [Synechococcaceae cyanobacterium SM2_3_1]|nr:Uma2 family endonuclease [Synechococcaceae cyanobacterium SM2_3_1]
MAEAGLFLDQRVQLIEGQVVEMSPFAPAGRSPMKSAHATAINFTAEILRSVLPAGTHIREQQPLVLSPISEPEPDIAVISGTIREYAQHHPTTALVVIEISDSTAFPNLVNYSMPKDL